VWNEPGGNTTHLHASAGYHSGDPGNEADHHATISTDRLRSALTWAGNNSLVLDPRLLDANSSTSLISRLNKVDQLAADTTLTAAQRHTMIRQQIKSFIATVKTRQGTAAAPDGFAWDPQGFGVRGKKAKKSLLVFDAEKLMEQY
jgi:hypothetical protein